MLADTDPNLAEIAQTPSQIGPGPVQTDVDRMWGDFGRFGPPNRPNCVPEFERCRYVCLWHRQ